MLLKSPYPPDKGGYGGLGDLGGWIPKSRRFFSEYIVFRQFASTSETSNIFLKLALVLTKKGFLSIENRGVTPSYKRFLSPLRFD